MHLALKTFTLALFLLAPAACGNGSTTSTGTGTGGSKATGAGGSTGTKGTGGSGPTAAAACAASAKESCTKRDTCSNGYANKKLYGDEPTCETRTAANCVASLGSKGDAQSPTGIEACVAAYPTYACTDFLDNNPPTACVPPAGTGAMGSACGVSGQCASTFCSIPQYEVCGTCQPLPVAGATCQVEADCGRDLACPKTATATAGVCTAFVALNGMCLTNVNPCEAGLDCVGDVVATMTMGTCQTAVATVGAACDATRKTMPACNNNDGLACIPTMAGSMGIGTCQAITLVAATMPCGSIGAMPITGVAACVAGGLCKKAVATNPAGTCVAAVADGMACDNDVTVGPPCLTTSKCVPTTPTGTAGTCTPPNANKCM